MFKRRVVWIGMGMLIMVLIVGCTIFTSQPKAAAQEQRPESLVQHTLPQPITMTVTFKNWECTDELAVPDVARVVRDRDVPKDETLVDIINKPDPGEDEYKPWYVYITEEDRITRRFIASGSGNDSYPECRAFNLEANEYVSWHNEAYFIRLEDSAGNEWQWMPYPEFYQRSNFGEVLYAVDEDPVKANAAYREFYKQFEVGHKVMVLDYFTQRGLMDVLAMEPTQ